MTQVLVNQWAFGVGDVPGCPGRLDGWQHNGRITVSRCPKNPALPDGTAQGGAAFKNGPEKFTGGGIAGEVATLWQDFDAPAAAPSFVASLSILAMEVNGRYLHADLYGIEEGQPEFIGRLLSLDFEASAMSRLLSRLPAFGRLFAAPTPCNSNTFWPTYCGILEGIPYYPQYRLVIDSVFNSGIGGLGVKWTGVCLDFAAVTLNGGE